MQLTATALIIAGGVLWDYWLEPRLQAKPQPRPEQPLPKLSAAARIGEMPIRCCNVSMECDSLATITVEHIIDDMDAVNEFFDQQKRPWG